MKTVLLLALSLSACAPSSGSQSPALSVQPLHVFPEKWGAAFRGTIHSAALGQDRVVNLYLPPTFDKTKRKYPVIFLTDGEYYFERMVLAARQLSGGGHIPQCIVAAIETPKRRQDMTPPGMSPSQSDGPDQRGEKFMKFLAEELEPALRKQFRAGAPNVLVGHSHGGILCAYAAAKWRKQFPFIVALDAPVHIDDGWLEKGLMQSVSNPANLRLVSLEVKFGWPEKDWAALQAAAPKTWKLSRMHLSGEDHESMVFDGFYNGLKELFADYNQVQVKNLSAKDAFTHYLSLEQEYGAAVIPPEYVLDRGLMALSSKGLGDLARKALALWVEGYGDRPDYAELSASIDDSEKAMKGQESVEQLLASPPPTPAQMAPYLGDWKGNSWVSLDPERLSPITVTFSIENGHGVGKAENFGAPPEFRNETFKYLRVTKDGIEFGNLNGMFPPGIVARIGKLKGSTLEGESLFKGVYFKELLAPDHPRHFFSLHKVK